MKILAYSFPNCEPIELIATIDVLRRAGLQVDIYGKEKLQHCSHNITIQTDIQEVPAAQYDMLLIPGGPGFQQLVSDTQAKSLAGFYLKNKKLASICATPGFVLGNWNLIPGKHITTYPGCELPSNQRNYILEQEKRVVVDGNLITAKGPGCCFDFALKIIEVLLGQDVMMKIKNSIIYE